MSVLPHVSRIIQARRADLMDLHDPDGVYFHRACNACLSTFIAAGGLLFVPAIATPLLVIATLCFALIATPRDRPNRPTTLLGSLLVVLLGTALLILTQTQPLLQAIVLMGLGFLIHYLPQFGSAFAGGLFVWVLSLLASAGNPSLEELPQTLLNIVLGWIIVYFCYFWLWPYRPCPILFSLLKRTRSRLAERLQRVVNRLQLASLEQESEPPRTDDLDQRIVSLLSTQHALLRQVEQKKRMAKSEIAHDRKIVATHEELFEAILVLEARVGKDSGQWAVDSGQKGRGRGLGVGGRGSELGWRRDVPVECLQQGEVPLIPGLARLSQQVSENLSQSSSGQGLGGGIQLEPGFEAWLQDWGGDRGVDLEICLQRQDLRQAMQKLVSRVNAVASLAVEPGERS